LNFVVPSLRPRSFDRQPPVSLAAAPVELLVAVREGRLVLQGRQRGIGPQSRVPVWPHDRLQDHGNAVCVGGADVHRGGAFWSDLWLSADACRARWPGAPGATAPAIAEPDRRAGRKRGFGAGGTWAWQLLAPADGGD
jgi:hypothetical protein